MQLFLVKQTGLSLPSRVTQSKSKKNNKKHGKSIVLQLTLRRHNMVFIKKIVSYDTQEHQLKWILEFSK